MNKKFIQEVLNTMMFKKLTTTFAFLKKEKLTQEDFKDSLKSLSRDGILSAMKNSGQDPQELADMGLIAFDESIKTIRERYKAMLDLMVAELKKQ